VIRFDAQRVGEEISADAVSWTARSTAMIPSVCLYGREIACDHFVEVAVKQRPAERSPRLPCVESQDLEIDTSCSCLLVEVTA